MADVTHNRHRDSPAAHATVAGNQAAARGNILMPQVPDDPSSALPSQIEDEAPLASPTSTTVDNASESDGSPGAAHEGHPRRSRRRRRRRPPPMLPAASPGDTPIKQTEPGGEPALPDGLPGTPLGAQETHKPPRRRRRRRRAPRPSVGQEETSLSSETKAEDAASTNSSERGISAVACPGAARTHPPPTPSSTPPQTAGPSIRG